MMALPPPSATAPKRTYTVAEKAHMLKNLELEVADRTHKFRKQMDEMVAAFVMRSQNEVTKVPRAVRAMPLDEFARHGGDVKRALAALAKDRLAAVPEPPLPPMSVKKRKWQEGSHDDGPGPRASKAARTYTSPTKPGPATLKKASSSAAAGRTPKTPRIIRPGGAHLGPIPSPMAARPPSAAHFNPHLPKTPALPALARSAVLRRKPSFMPSAATPASSAAPMALVSVPTRDGQVIELDPLSASPGAIDALEGITDSAKRHAKDEMARLVHGALAKWSIA